MRRALALARRGRVGTSPNPMVGAVVVRRGKIVGEGYHRRCGGPHAEVAALAAAGARATQGADLYVTLEPCGHFGRTPPCARAIVEAGIVRVTYAAPDPNPATCGAGPRWLRRHGVAVVKGICRAEAEDLNAPYLHWRRSGQPWVILKYAMTLDGKIASRSGESQWITGSAARRYAHQLRRRVDAVLVGTETARRDNPNLAPRPPRGRWPLRVVLDRRGRLPLSLDLLARPFVTADQGQTVYVTSRGVSKTRLERLRRRGVRIVLLPRGRRGVDPGVLLDALGSDLGVSQLLVEGGGSLAGSFLSAGKVHEVAAFVAPRLLGGIEAPAPVGGVGLSRLADTPWLEAPRVRKLGDDFLMEGRIKPRA